MRFIDEATIKIAAGHGGPGSVSFRREKFIPRGGPDGGDGGAGGSIIFVASDQTSTLQDFRFKRSYQAENGHHGSGTNKAGRDGEDVVLRVPVGTIIKDAETGEVLIDFTEPGQEWFAAKGGRGGKGNAHFVSSTHQAPKFAQEGEEGEKKTVILELKLLADAAIIGFPNAGKSTLISRISAARPKVADYAFTTLTPNLGVVSMPEFESFVVADIPGLIEGAHRGLGLGTKFLKHIERTRVFIHLLDGTKLLEDLTRPYGESQDPVTEALEEVMKRYRAIRTELGLFNEKLLHKTELVAFNKLDLIETDKKLIDRLAVELRKQIAIERGMPPEDGEPFFVSGVSGAGIQELLLAVFKKVKSARPSSSVPHTHKLKDTTKVILPDDEGLR